MGMELLLIRTIENSLHRGNIQNPGRGRANHSLFELADKIERNNGINNLGRVTID